MIEKDLHQQARPDVAKRIMYWRPKLFGRTNEEVIGMNAIIKHFYNEFQSN